MTFAMLANNPKSNGVGRGSPRRSTSDATWTPSSTKARDVLRLRVMRQNGPGLCPNRIDLDRAGGCRLEHLECASTPAFHGHPGGNLEDQSFGKAVDGISAVEIAGQYECLEHQLLDAGICIRMPSVRFGAG
jgi:hypothetical protein